MKPDIKKQEKLVREWNEKYPVGTAVIVTMDDGAEVRTMTVHEATMLGGHTAVAWLEEINGCYSLEMVRPDTGRPGTPWRHDRDGCYSLERVRADTGR